MRQISEAKYEKNTIYFDISAGDVFSSRNGILS